MAMGRWLVVAVVALLLSVCGAVRPKGMRHFEKFVGVRRRQSAAGTVVGKPWRDPESMSLIETIMRAGVTMVDSAHLPSAYNVPEVMNNASNYVEYEVKAGEDIDTLAHNFYFGDHWKAMDLLMFNIQLQRAKAGATDFAAGTKVVIPKPIRMCKDGWKAFGGPRKLEQHCEKVLPAEECVKHHGKHQEDGNCVCDVRCLGNLKCSDYKDWVPDEAVGNHPLAGWGPVPESSTGPAGMTGGTGGMSETGRTGGMGETGGTGGTGGTGPADKATPFWSGALKLLGKKNATAAGGGAAVGAAAVAPKVEGKGADVSGQGSAAAAGGPSLGAGGKGSVPRFAYGPR